MSAIVWDRISVFTNARSRFPRFSFVAWFPVKVKILIPRLNYFEGAVSWKKRTVGTSYGSECIRNQKYEANRVERTLIEQWKTRRLWLLVSVLWHTCMHEQYDPGGCIRAKTRLKLVARKEGSQLCKTTEKWNAYKTSHKFFCHNRDTNLASNFLSEETAWHNIIVFARAKNVATRLTCISLLFVKIPLKLFGPANFDSVRWNIALRQTECPVKYFCLREVCTPRS